MATIRRDLVDTALKFLQDQNVQSSPLAKRIAFLESKGLTSQEIDEALKLFNSSSAVTPASNIPPMLPPRPQNSWNWKDWLLLVIGTSSISYGSYYLLYHHLPKYFPSFFNGQKDKLNEKLESITEELAKIKTEQDSIFAEWAKQSALLKESLDNLTVIIEKFNPSEIDLIQDKVNSIQESMNNMTEKTIAGMDNMLQNIQNEVASLKTLSNNIIQNEIQDAGIPELPEWQKEMLEKYTVPEAKAELENSKENGKLESAAPVHFIEE